MTRLYKYSTINENTMFLKPEYETGYSLIININFHGCKTLIMFNSYTDIAKSSCQNKDHPIHLISYDNYNKQLIHTYIVENNQYFFQKLSSNSRH